ncbi:MAG: hypothetical protein HS100_19660 [Anaerolineales bacterium]|nr:hypothetical protein [Anaerolineales bacterium]
MDKSLEPFRASLEALQRLLHKFDDRGVIIGGIAVGFLGKPRLWWKEAILDPSLIFPSACQPPKI